MKLLIATPLYPPDVGGPATYAKTLEQELPQREVAVTLVSFHTVRHLPKGIAHLAYLVKVFRAARSCELILALDPVSVGLPAVLVAILLRKKFVVKVVGDYAWEQGSQRFGVTETLDEFVQKSNSAFRFGVVLLRTIQTFVAARATRIIVPSEYLKSIVSEWGMPKEKISVVYNAFPRLPDLPDKEPLRKKYALQGTVILSAGRLVPWKGFATLMTLMPQVRETVPEARLVIAGGGPMEADLRALITEHHLEDLVTILGNVPHDTLMEYIRASDIFVLNTGYEGLSHQLLEVLAVGTPILTTNVGGNPELIEDGVTGLLVPYDDPDALRLGMQKLATDFGLASSFTFAGKQFVSSFTKERMIAGTLDVLKSIVEK